MYRDHLGKVHGSSTQKAGMQLFWRPCQYCGECRISQARQKASRAVHEQSRWKQSCFITLTYKNEPKDKSLHPEDTKGFIRRLQYRLKHPIKYMLVGEYGDKTERPHYHALIYGTDFGLSHYRALHREGISVPQKKIESLDPSDLEILHETAALRSPELEDLWELGHASVGDLTFDSAAYACRYSLKKITGDSAPLHYGNRLPEFIRMSTKPALGARWFAKYGVQTYRHDSMVVNGALQTPPRYYDKLLRRSDPDKLDKLKKIRTANAGQYRVRPVDGQKKLTTEQRREQTFNRSKKRLAVLEESAQLRAKQFKRNL